MNTFKPAELLRKIEQEEKDFRARYGHSPSIRELSEPVYGEIQQYIEPVIIGRGLSVLKTFLSEFL